MKTWEETYNRLNRFSTRQMKVKWTNPLTSSTASSAIPFRSNHRTQKAGKSPLKSSKYKMHTPEVASCESIKQAASDEAVIWTIPTLQIPSSLPSSLTPKQELSYGLVISTFQVISSWRRIIQIDGISMQQQKSQPIHRYIKQNGQKWTNLYKSVQRS